MQSKVDGYTRTSNAIEQQRGKLERLQAEHEKVSQKIQAHQTNAERLRAKIEETGDATGELTAQLVREENEVAKNTERLKSNENQIRQTTASIHSQEEQLERMAQELRDAGIDTDNLEESNARLQRSYERLRGSQENLNRINSEQAKIKENIAATKTQLLGTIGAIGAVTAAIYAGPVQAAQEYETAIAKVSTIADANAVPIEEMSSEIMKLSNTTGIAASQIADDVYNAISAGQQTGDAVNFVSYSTKLAKAGFAESAQTLDVLTTILNAYGMEAGEVSKVSDMLVQTQNKGKVSVGELSSVMGKIIPTANANNVALEQLCAGYAIMTNKGIVAAETTTYMNSMLNELSKSGTTAEKTLRATTGKSFKELMTEGKSLGEVIQILQQEAEKSGKSLNDMFGSAEAGKAAVSLLSGGVEGFNEQVAGMVDSVGATEEAFAKMDQTTEAKMQKAKNSIANLGIVLGQNLLPIVGNLADKVAAVVIKVSEFAQANPKLVQTALKVAAALAGMKVAGLTAKLGFLHISSGIKDAQKILELFKIKAIGLSGIGSKVVGFITKPFSGIGGILGKALSGIGGIVARSPLGSIGRVVASSFGKIGSFIAPVGNIIKKALGPLGKIGSTLLGPLGGIAGKFLPVVGVITAVITAVKLLRDNFDKVRDAVGRIFGEKGLEIFDKIVAVVTSVGETIKGVFSDGNLGAARDKIQEIFGEKGVEIFDKIVAVVTSVGETIKGVFSDGNLGAARDKIQEIFGEKGVAVFDTFAGVFQKVVAAAGQFVGFVNEHIVPVVEDILELLVTTVIPGIINGVQAAAPVVMEVFQAIADFIGGIIPIIGDFIAGIMPVISEVITFIQTYVLPIVGEVFNFIVQQVLPFIVQGIQQLGSIITTVLQAVLPVVQTVFTTIWNIIQPILQQVLTTVQAVLPAVLSIFQNVFNTIGGIISAVQQVLSGIIQFITGVFSGNWSQAWEGIKSIFSGVWDGILSICKGVINGITGAVNVVIRGLNSLKVPDWVPGIGGKGINIPEIPQLAKGSKSTPDTFIAGEAGPELITNAPGRTVYTAQQTKDIFSAQNAAAQVAQAAGAGQTASQVFYNTTNNAPEVKPPEVVSGAGAGGGNNITITNSPTIYVDSDKAGDLEEKLEENNRNLLQEVEDLLDKRNDDERRSRHE
ncbi:phage tail tape measure protein [uncultured Escherichia sp.]|uniref:phage tail tape measure protein n=1 Tax=uncultured Escherichia sp. TaxID=237777 RepID=UPI00267621A1|nr:phage tail tape measure protein [uncultured Escherichia sp.]